MLENKLFGNSGSLAGPLASSANKQKIILFKKMRDRLRIVLALLQLPRQIADQLCGLQRDRGASDGCLEAKMAVKPRQC
jgi:hypothetical protein